MSKSDEKSLIRYTVASPSVEVAVTFALALPSHSKASANVEIKTMMYCLKLIRRCAPAPVTTPWIKGFGASFCLALRDSLFLWARMRDNKR